MIYAQATKKVPMEPASFTNGATASLVIDRLGFDYASIDIQLGHVDSTSHVPSTLKLQEADVNAATNFVDITSPTSFTTLAPAAGLTAGVQAISANVDCRNRKRYIQLVVIPVTTQVIGAVANLSRGHSEVSNATDANVAVQVNG